MSQVFLYDTTLRDGTQREDISLSVDDKLVIARRLAISGFTTSRAAGPLQPQRREFFARAAKLDLGAAKLAAFGRTGRSTDNASRMQPAGTLEAATPVVTMWARVLITTSGCAHSHAGRESAMIATACPI